MKKRLPSILLTLMLTLAMLPAAAYAAEGPDYQTVLMAQLEAGARPSANNLFLGISQWKAMEDGPEKRSFAIRYAGVRTLDMSGMGLKQNGSSDDLSLLEPFIGLEALDLSTKADTANENKNTLKNLGCLENLTSLRQLDASGNQLQGKDAITGLLGCQRLETLNLSGNKNLGSSGGASDALAPLAELYNVRELNLSGTGFGNNDVKFVQAMESLTVLDISNTQVKNLDLSEMRGLTRLTAKDLTLDSLKLPESVREVDLTGTKLKVKDANADDAVTLMGAYADSGLKLVNSNNTSQEVFSIAVADAANGAAKASVKTAAQGSKVSITVTPEKGYAQDSILVSYVNAEGKAESVPVSNGEFTMPKANVTVTVQFMELNVSIEYNTTERGSVSLEKEAPSRGERVNFATKLSNGYKVRQITGRIGSKTVPVYRSADGTYCFDMPRLKAGEVLTFDVTIVEVVTPRYSGSGQFGGQLTLSGLVEGQRYVCQMCEAGSGDTPPVYTIVTFTAQSATEKLEVRSNTKGYIVSLWKYDPWASSVQDLTNVIYEVATNR